MEQYDKDFSNFDKPQMFVHGAGLLDCRDEVNFLSIVSAFHDKRDILESAKLAAIKDFGSGSTTTNPHSKIFSPLRWTAWLNSYYFWRKHFNCSD